MLVRQLTTGLQKFRRRAVNTTFALDRLQYNTADVIVHGSAQGGDVIARYEAHAFEHGIETLAVLVLCRKSQRSHGAAVKGVLHRDERGLVRTCDGMPGGSHQLDRAFN